ATQINEMTLSFNPKILA
ncbi:flagellar biosynthetic protein FliQ, partial [Salmonella enterica subsp. enterica serovar Infantis]